MSYNQGWRVDQHVRAARDVNADGKADLIGFGNEGVWLMENQGNSFGAPTLVVNDLGNNQGWTLTDRLRTLADVNGDGRLDAVGFGEPAVYVALKNAGPGYGTVAPWLNNDFTLSAGWHVATHARLMGDVDADGRADIVGIDDWGVYVSRALPNGSFEPKQLWIRAFSQSQGWDATKHLRVLADVNNDGRADIVGFADDGVYVSLSTGTTFTPPAQVSSKFGYSDGWRLEHIRVLANVDGDRYPDIVGIGINGVTVARGGASGFGAASTWINDFGTANGWDATKHPRFVADVDGDGMADIVGIKDDQAVLARSTGTSFATPQGVLADFTYNKGWRVDKHPRFVADVDGDGELDLVGLFDDAVYWDRLTPPAAPLPPNWDVPTCTASRLGPPAPRTCEGPWSYTQIQRKVSVDDSCPTYCSSFSACPLWENGASPGATTAEGTTIFGPDTRLCTQLCNNNGCNAASCSGTITPPTFLCQGAADSRAGDVRSQVAALVMNEPNFDSAAAQSQRATDARDVVTVTASTPIVKFNQRSQPGPGGTLKSWNEHYGCSLSIRSAAPVTAANSACACSATAHSSCEHDDVATTLYTAPGQERPTSPYVTNQICMTHDDMPQTTPAEVQAKFDALWTTYQGTPPPTVPAATFQRAMVTRLKLIYELFGDKLIDQHTASDEVHHAISLYASRPGDNPACALDIDAPATPAGCTNPAVANTHGDLIRCQRLLATHAAEGVASLASSDCIALLTGYLGLKSQTADDSTCGGPHLRQVGASTAFKLEDKQLGVINSAPTTLGAFARQLWLFDGWYTVSRAADAAGVFSAPDQQRRDTSFLLGEFWSHVRANTSADAKLTEAAHASTTDQAEQALGLSAGASRSGEQSVITALFTVPPPIQPENVTLTRPPLRSLPLLAMLGDALKPLVDDLDGLAVYHDIACQFRDCRAPTTDTPSRSAWKLLSELEAGALANDVAANTHALVGWNAVFGKLASQQATFLQAVGDAVTGSGGLSGATSEADVQPLARPLWLLYKHARALHDHYEATGMFEPTAQNQLHGSLLSQDQHGVATGLRARVNAFDGQVSTYRNGLINALQAEIAVMDAGARLQDLTDTRLHKAEEMDQKGQNLEGLRASGEDEDDAFGNLTASFADIQHALDHGAYVQVGDTTTLTLDGRSGKFTGHETLPEIAVHAIPDLVPGQMLVVQSTGLWTPTCSLSEAKFFGAGGDHPLPADLSNAAIGPEGYTITSTGGTFEAHSSGHAFGTEMSVGSSMKYCGDNGVTKIFGLKVELCAFAELKGTGSMTTTSNGGDEARSTASFNTGIRMPDAPFPDAPVGSLLVVLTDHDSGAIRDIKVVHSGGTSILVQAPGTAYFIANDKRCTTSANSQSLNVSIRTVSKQTEVAEKALISMAEVLDYMRQQRLMWINQGALLPTQATLLRQQANFKLQTHLDEIDVAALPGPLASLFEAFVSHQIVSTERQIQITAIERSLNLDVLEMRTIDDEINAGAAHARLQRLVPQWIIRDLDHDSLRHNLVDVLSVARDFLKPILDLWYPTAEQGLADSPEILAMINADIDTSLVTLASNGSRFVNALLTAYENGTFGSKPPGQQLPVVVLNFPRPGQSFTSSFWRQADETRSRRVWDAINAHTVAHFEVTPDDFYSKNGGDAVLSCNEVVPLIKTAEVYVVRPGGDVSNATLNGASRTFQGSAGASQSFVAPEGPRVYELADAAWQSFVLPVRYGEDEAAVNTFNATPRQTRPVGLSASGAFDVDFSVLDTLPQHGQFDSNDPFLVTGVQLIMELDSRAVGTGPTWVNRCK